MTKTSNKATQKEPLANKLLWYGLTTVVAILITLLFTSQAATAEKLEKLQESDSSKTTEIELLKNSDAQTSKLLNDIRTDISQLKTTTTETDRKVDIIVVKLDTLIANG